MRAAVTPSGGSTLELTDLPEPTPAPDEVVVRVERCGICGSDLHGWRLAAPGTVLGHEIGGEVVAIGGEVGHGLRTGQRVAVFPLLGCGRCRGCLSGDIAACPQVGLLGTGVPGGFAELVAVKAFGTLRVPDALGPAEAALVEPLAVGLHAVRRSRIEPGEPVLVLGGGPIGFAAALWARRLGAGEVVVSEPMAARRVAAEAIGAATVDPTREDPGTAARRIAGRDARVVIECTGRPGIVNQALGAVAHGGHVTVAGVCWEADTVHHLMGLLKGLTVAYALYYNTADFDTVAKMLAGGGLDPALLVTDTIALSALPERFAALGAPAAPTPDGATGTSGPAADLKVHVAPGLGA